MDEGAFEFEEPDVACHDCGRIMPISQVAQSEKVEKHLGKTEYQYFCKVCTERITREEKVSCKYCDSEDVKEVGVTLFPERDEDLYSFICNECDKSFQLFQPTPQCD